MREELYVIENVPFKDRKMLIPQSLRSAVLEGLHAAHQGVNSMLSNARLRLFWPGLDSEVKQLRAGCRQCNEQAPSQPSEPIVVPLPPEVPFQQSVADLFHLEGHTFLAYADRFSGWLEVEKLRGGSFSNVRQCLLRWFRTYGVPEELAADGGPPFQSYEYKRFLRTWGVERRLSSGYYPQSNRRAEAAVKSAKRILLGNIDPITGNLDTDAAARAIMLHRNTPNQDTGIAPSIMLFGRLLRDHLPDMNRTLRPEWKTIADAREMALAKRAIKSNADNKRELVPLNIGDCVQLQNQTGAHPTKWFSTGVVAEVLPHRQYNVVVDGSRRTTLRNRRFLRKIQPMSRKAAYHPDTDIQEQPTPLQDVLIPNGCDENSDHEHVLPTPTEEESTATAPNPPVQPIPDRQEHQPRRSGRVRKQTTRFVAKIGGKTHDYE